MAWSSLPLGRVVRATVGAAIGLLLGEGWVRVSGHDPLDDPRLAQRANTWAHDCVVVESELRYHLAPGACGANSLGLLDDERPFLGAPDELRVAAFGDSVTADRMYTDFLEVLLAERLGRPVAVFNFGTTGWSTEEEAAQAELRLPEVRPHAAILQFTPNDYQGTPVYVRVGDEVRVMDRMAAEGPLTRWLLARSAAWRLLSARPGLRPPATERAGSVHAALARFAAASAAAGAPAWVLVVPELWDAGRTPEPIAWATADVVEASAAAGLGVVDLREPFAATEVGLLRRDRALDAWARLDQLPMEAAVRAALAGTSRERLLLRPGGDDGDVTHPNFYGHVLAAQALADALTPTLRDPGR